MLEHPPTGIPYRASPDQEITHVSLIGGSFYVPWEKNTCFLNSYFQNHLYYRHAYTERPTAHLMPVVFDIDHYQTHSTGGNDVLDKYMYRLRDLIRKYFGRTGPVLLMKSPSPTQKDKKGRYKFGAHIHFYKIYVTPNELQMISKHAIQEGIDVDESVCTSGLRMFGSDKPLFCNAHLKLKIGINTCKSCTWANRVYRIDRALDEDGQEFYMCDRAALEACSVRCNPKTTVKTPFVQSPPRSLKRVSSSNGNEVLVTTAIVGGKEIEIEKKNKRIRRDNKKVSMYTGEEAPDYVKKILEFLSKRLGYDSRQDHDYRGGLEHGVDSDGDKFFRFLSGYCPQRKLSQGVAFHNSNRTYILCKRDSPRDEWDTASWRMIVNCTFCKTTNPGWVSLPDNLIKLPNK